ncbi:hypothetical protein AB2C47_32475 [Pseudomonas aeruginosa]
MGAKPKAQTVGFRYYFDIHFALGKKVDEVCAIRASGKTAWKGSITSNGQVRINAPELFGGDKGEGGLDGTLDVLFGEEDQGVLPRLAAMLGGLVPAFRGVTTCFYSGLVTSVNWYPKKWEILRRGGNRLWDGNPWYPEKQFIWLADGQIKAMNPAHILYLVYTGRDFRGLARTRMDEASWRAAADKLYAEGFGLCFEWTRSDTFANFCETVKSHIGAEVYPKPPDRTDQHPAPAGRLQRRGTCRCSTRTVASWRSPGEDRLDLPRAEPAYRQVHRPDRRGAAPNHRQQQRGRRVAGAAGRPRKSSSWACRLASWPGESVSGKCV